MFSVLSNKSEKLAGHPSSEDSFGSYSHREELDGVVRLDREKIRRPIKEGASIFRKALSVRAKGRRRMGSITEAKRRFEGGGIVGSHEEGGREGHWA